MARASRLPEAWIPPQAWIDWATQNCPGINGRETAEVFADYWHGVPGSRGTKMDWFGTWRNWCRREYLRQPSAKQPARKSDALTQGNIAAAQRVFERLHREQD